MVQKALIAVGGENLIDYVDREGVATAYPGGSPYNVAMALGRLGANVTYISPISDDRWGDLLAQTLVNSNVVLSGGRRLEPTTMARVTVSDGIPSYSFERDGTAERAVTFSSLGAALPANADAIHTGSLTLTDGPDADAWERFCAACFDEGVLVSIDPNVRVSVIADIATYRARIMRMLGRAHLLKLSDEDLEALFPGLAPAAALAELREATAARLVVLTKGGDGISAWLDDSRIDMAAEALPQLADTVGAGDTFSAALLAGLAETGVLSPDGLKTLKYDKLRTLLQRANAAAALNCARAGCDPPTQAELEAALHRKA
jgi:fructokinase